MATNKLTFQYRFMYWLEYCVGTGRSGQQERQHVLEAILGAEYAGQKLV